MEVAQKFYENSDIQERAGTLARLDVITAESQLATAQYDLVNSQTNLRQQELQLKNLLSRNGIADPTARHGPNCAVRSDCGAGKRRSATD